MEKGKDLKLVNIYIKIHNKKTLTMDDLAYLAKYNPECFRKTCDNLIYKMPETKTLVTPPEETAIPEKKQEPAEKPKAFSFEATVEEQLQNQQLITQFLNSIMKMESSDIDVLQNINVTQVKELVGNLFMENLFPHNGLQGYFETPETEPISTFDVTA